MQGVRKKGVVCLAICLVAGFVIFANRVAESRRLDAIIDAANESIEGRDFAAASAHLNEYLAARPKDIPIRLLAAQTARRNRDFDIARKHLRIYQDLDGPKEPRARERQLLLAQEDGGAEVVDLLESCLSATPPEDVDLACEVAIEQMLNFLDSSVRAGMSILEGPRGKARDRTELAIQLWFQRRPGQADQVQGLIWRANLNQWVNLASTHSDYRRALEIDPNHFKARTSLAMSLMNYDAREATQHLELLHQRVPSDQHVSIQLAISRRNIGEFQGAILLLDEVLLRTPDEPNALLERGKAALDLDRPAEAERFLRQALDRAPNDPFVHLALSRCLLLSGKESQGRHHEQRYTELSSEQLRAGERQAEAQREMRKKMELGLGPPGT